MVFFVRWGSRILTLGALDLVLGALALGCTSVPTFPPPAIDAGTQCSMTEACPSGQQCLQGRCYASCDMTHPCSAREMCSMGVCVANTNDAGTPPRDMGTDGGPCAMMTCTSPTPVCLGDVAMCIQCDAVNHDECGTTTGPICDVGRGHCTAAAPGLCAPCNVTADCPTGLSCVHRTSPDPEERVCLPGCGMTACADQGFSCALPVCVPFAGSCTAYRAAIMHQTCAHDADCPQLGATLADGLFDGMCFDDGSGSMTCHAACGSDSDCTGGLHCLPSPSGGSIHFCQ